MNKAEKYISDVINNKVVVCKYVKLAVKRHLQDLKDCKKKGIYFDTKAGERAIKFCKYVNHTKGEWAGKPFILEPWQMFCDYVIFGWKNDDGTRRFNYAYIEVARKNGKALAIDTPIPTVDGWKLMRDIQIGDIVFDEQGNQCNVINSTSIQYNRECYKIYFSDKTNIIADKEHLWMANAKVNMPGIKKGREFNSSGKIRTTEELYINQRYGQRNDANYTIDLCKYLKTDEKYLPIPPYTLGIWLGDGNTKDARITINSKDVEIIAGIIMENVNVKEHKSPKKSVRIFLLGSNGISQKGRDNSLQAKLRRYNILNNKHIPSEYLRTSFRQRLLLLKGLMDTDGYISKDGQCEYTTIIKKFAFEVLELMRTFGLKPTIKEEDAKLYGRICSKKYRIQFWPNELFVFSVIRKLERQKYQPINTRAYRRSIVKIDKIDSVPVKCIQVDSKSHLYLAGESFIPTHNSSWAAKNSIYFLDADGEPAAEIYCFATKEEQAKKTGKPLPVKIEDKVDDGHA